jgi:glycosyltransferase involved in cell wall biosynthesis
MSSLRVALMHNLTRGGAWRTIQEHAARTEFETLEFCLQSATPVTATAKVVPFASSAGNVRPLLRPVPRHLDLARLIKAWRDLAVAVNAAECDIVLAHPCQFLQAPLALRWTSSRSVYFCHEPRRVDYEGAAAATVNPRTRLLYAGLHRTERQLDRWALAAADALLTNSRFTATRIAHAYGREAEPIPLGVADAFREAGPGDERKHLLSVGTLIPSKGHDLAIRVAGLTAARRPLVVVAPRREPDEVARLHAMAEHSGTPLDIRIGVSDEELRELYLGALCTLYLARDEPFGLVSLEAQACGSPVVVAAEGGLPETMVAGRTGWTVNRDDVTAAAEAIDRLEDPETLDSFSQQAREHGTSQTWERSAASLEAAMRRVVAR